MELPALIYAGAGAAALLAALLPRALHRLPLSMPMVFLGLGVIAFAVLPDLPDADPMQHRVAVERLTEVCVIIALMGAGLALDRQIGAKRWGSTWRMLAVAMPLLIAAVALLGWWALGLAPAAALLLGAVLAPTDPVLAGDVQVGEPSDERDSEDEPRFALTSEAGLNDGLAFPFTYAAIAMATAGASPAAWFLDWAAVDLLWRIAAGGVVGLAVGWVLGTLFFRSLVPTLRLAEQAEGFVAIACTFLAYGLAELIEGYGFIAVFVCACAIRAAERDHGYHQVMHSYIEQIERLLTVGILVLLGGAIADGLLDPLRGWDIALALLLILVLRPVTGALSLIGSGLGPRDRAVIAFFGVRGVGSLYYLAYALGHGKFAEAERLWAITGLVILISIVVHGVAATPVMRALDRRRRWTARRSGTQEPVTSVSV